MRNGISSHEPPCMMHGGVKHTEHHYSAYYASIFKTFPEHTPHRVLSNEPPPPKDLSLIYR